MTELEVVRVEVRAPVVSFRHPYFLIGRQPTYEMPPPSTIYGFVASALGELFDPTALRFSYRFQYKCRASDYEHQHIITAAGARQSVCWQGERLRKSVNGEIQPHLRDFLFQVRLVLYLDNPELARAFRHPVFPVVFGRSQDLAEIVRVEVVRLQQRQGGYLENTLLPFSFRERLALGYTVWMPRYIGPPPQRQPVFDRFIVLHERVYAGAVEQAETLGVRRLMATEGTEETWWIDPETACDRGLQAAVFFQPFVQ